MAKTKTRKTRTPKPIPALLEGAFATNLENTIAEFNNQLAREGRMTDDPAYVMLRQIRRELVKEGVATFNRVVGDTPTAPAAAPKASTKGKRKASKAAPSTPPAADKPPVRECTEDEVMSLVVEGTMGEDGAPYGRDSKGVALAPYGVKLDGTPKLRRGRGVPPWEREPEIEEPEGDDTTAEASGDSEDAAAAEADSGTEETAEASSEDDDSEEDAEEDSDDDSEEDAEEDSDDEDLGLTDSDLDDLLNDL